MKNTGYQYATSWNYRLGDRIVGTCRLLRPAGDSFYSDAEVALLPEAEYREAHRRTVAYMRNVLGWGAIPEIGDCCRVNTSDCPL